MNFLQKLNKNKSDVKYQYTIRCNLGIDVLNQKTNWLHCLIGCYMEKLNFTSFYHAWLIVSVYGTLLYSFNFVYNENNFFFLLLWRRKVKLTTKVRSEIDYTWDKNTYNFKRFQHLVQKLLDHTIKVGMCWKIRQRSSFYALKVKS